MADRLGIWNQAVAELPASQIASLAENSLEARECRRFYPQIIAEMLEAPHDWSFQNKREILAETTNDRPNEWAYAYAVPSDMATPIRIIPDLEALGLGLPVALSGEPYAETWASFVTRYEAPYLIQNGKLYTNVETATLEYGINDITEAVIPALTVRAIAIDLASRLAMPVKKDKDLRQRLTQEAELWWQRAIADDENRQPSWYPDPGYIPEAIAARGC